MPNLSNYDNPTEDMESEALAQWLRLKKLKRKKGGRVSPE